MRLALFLLFLTSAIYANEIQRIESIIEDIANLRTSYEKCKKDLKDINPHVISNEIDIKNSNNKLILLKEKSVALEEKIVKTQNIIKECKNLLKTKEKTIFNLENKDNSNNLIVKKRYSKLLKTKENKINSLKNRIKGYRNTKKQMYIETNQFPTLMMKKKYQRRVKSKPKNLKIDKLFVDNVASTYRLLKDSNIYNFINEKSHA